MTSRPRWAGAALALVGLVGFFVVHVRERLSDLAVYIVAGQRFIDGVIDDFLGKVVRAGGVCVHARALAHRVETAQDFNGRGGVLIGH